MPINNVSFDEQYQNEHAEQWEDNINKQQTESFTRQEILFISKTSRSTQTTIKHSNYYSHSADEIINSYDNSKLAIKE